MQASIKEHEVKSFKPFTLEIRVESQDELTNLWHRFNLSEYEIKSSYVNYNPPHPVLPVSTRNIWELLDEKLNPQDYD